MIQNNLIVAPINGLVEIRLKFLMLRRLLKEEQNEIGFASLSSSTNVLIKLESMDDALKFVKFSKYVPNHSQLDLKFGYYKFKLKYLI